MKLHFCLLLALAGAAEGASPAGSCGGPGMREVVLQKVNAVRASGRVCGGQRFAAARPLAWNTALSTAATRHSSDMARRNYFAHNSPDGTRVNHRVSEAGYSWRAVGENIAGGNTSTQAVMAGWLASGAHCRNIMNPVYSDVAVACVQRSGSAWGSYWTMVLAAPR